MASGPPDTEVSAQSTKLTVKWLFERVFGDILNCLGSRWPSVDLTCIPPYSVAGNVNAPLCSDKIANLKNWGQDEFYRTFL